MIPTPPWNTGAGNNAKRTGWAAFFTSCLRTSCPFPIGRPDLRLAFEEGWDAAQAHALAHPEVIVPEHTPSPHDRAKAAFKAFFDEPGHHNVDWDFACNQGGPDSGVLVDCVFDLNALIERVLAAATEPQP